MTAAEENISISQESSNESNKESVFSSIKPLLLYGVIFSFVVLLSTLHTPNEPFGVLSLLPVSFTIVAAILTKRALEPQD